MRSPVFINISCSKAFQSKKNTRVMKHYEQNIYQLSFMGTVNTNVFNMKYIFTILILNNFVKL